jgi:hypothetical protein
VVRLEGAEPSIVLKLIEFFYKGRYTHVNSDKAPDLAILHAQVFAASDYYQVADLRPLALGCFREALFRCELNEVEPVVEFAMAHVPEEAKDLRGVVIDYLDSKRKWVRYPAVVAAVNAFELTFDLLQRSYRQTGQERGDRYEPNINTCH